MMDLLLTPLPHMADHPTKQPDTCPSPPRPAYAVIRLGNELPSWTKSSRQDGADGAIKRERNAMCKSVTADLQIPSMSSSSEDCFLPSSRSLFRQNNKPHQFSFPRIREDDHGSYSDSYIDDDCDDFLMSPFTSNGRTIRHIRQSHQSNSSSSGNSGNSGRRITLKPRIAPRPSTSPPSPTSPPSQSPTPLPTLSPVPMASMASMAFMVRHTPVDAPNVPSAISVVPTECPSCTSCTSRPSTPPVRPARDERGEASEISMSGSHSSQSSLMPGPLLFVDDVLPTRFPTMKKYKPSPRRQSRQSRQSRPGARGGRDNDDADDAASVMMEAMQRFRV